MDKHTHRPYRLAPLLLLGGIIGTACTVLLAKDQEEPSVTPTALNTADMAAMAMPLVQNERVRQLISMGEAFASPALWQAREYSNRTPSTRAEPEVLMSMAPDVPDNDSNHYRFHF